MPEGIIVKALSGFYYVKSEDGYIQCRARGKFRLDGTSPLVGDLAEYENSGDGTGYIKDIKPRKNSFIRPAVANVDYLVLLCSNVNPITDPFLVDRICVIAENAGCSIIICINKCDLDPGNRLYEAFKSSGYRIIRTSAKTGEGVSELRKAISGKIVAFTGNSGVGKSSLLNALEPRFAVLTGEVSERLGRGKHTTRHVELFELGDNTFVVDTPGFAAFDISQMSNIKKHELQHCFPEFLPYIGSCRFDDCAHINEPGCSVLQALQRGEISSSRHESYIKLYEAAAKIKDWEQK